MGRQADDDGRYFIGSLADVSIWKRLVTTSEFNTLWGTFQDNTSTATSSVKGVRVDALSDQSGLLAHWKLDNLNFTNSAVATDEKDSLTNVPANTRYEETDTRKMYRFANISSVVWDSSTYQGTVEVSGSTIRKGNSGSGVWDTRAYAQQINGVGTVYETTTVDPNDSCINGLNDVNTTTPTIGNAGAKLGIRIEDDVLVTKKGNQVLTKKLPKKKDEIENEVIHLKNKKEKAQPTKIKTGGSTFKNPIKQTNKKVWEIIKESVPNDIQFGDAIISEKHANFFINKNNASYKDMKKLIDFVKERVKNKTGVKLDLEIILVE